MRVSSTYKQHGCLAAIGVFLLIALLVVAILMFEGWLVMLLWNAVVVSVFGAPVLSYWASVGIVLLCNILFKSTSTSSSSD